jgi:MFS superfamily sulfate permease-like transporter
LVTGRTKTLPNIVVLAFHAPLSFLNAYHFRCDVLAALRNAPEPVRLVFWKRARFWKIDFTAAQVLRDLIRRQKEHIVFAIAQLESIRAQESIEPVWNRCATRIRPAFS